MRFIIPNVMSEQVAKTFVPEYLDWNDSRLKDVLDVVANNCDADTAGPAYARVEDRPAGHPWHRDVGTKNHMDWCRYSGRLLLDPPSAFQGGEFYFKDEPTTPIFGYLSVVLYDNDVDNEHFVASHSGSRRVLLMFFS
tara:strand:+ start:814 stop:1227 length:414 start_codon:yes stop_codon:yes gene_type:complete